MEVAKTATGFKEKSRSLRSHSPRGWKSKLARKENIDGLSSKLRRTLVGRRWATTREVLNLSRSARQKRQSALPPPQALDSVIAIGSRCATRQQAVRTKWSARR